MPNLAELLLLAGLGLLLFGKRLPKVGKSLGSGIRGFKQGLSGSDVASENAGAKVVSPTRLEGPYAPGASRETPMPPVARPRVSLEAAPTSIPGNVATDMPASGAAFKARESIVDGEHEPARPLDAHADHTAR